MTDERGGGEGDDMRRLVEGGDMRLSSLSSELLRRSRPSASGMLDGRRRGGDILSLLLSEGGDRLPDLYAPGDEVLRTPSVAGVREADERPLGPSFGDSSARTDRRGGSDFLTGGGDSEPDDDDPDEDPADPALLFFIFSTGDSDLSFFLGLSGDDSELEELPSSSGVGSATLRGLAGDMEPESRRCRRTGELPLRCPRGEGLRRAPGETEDAIRRLRGGDGLMDERILCLGGLCIGCRKLFGCLGLMGDLRLWNGDRLRGDGEYLRGDGVRLRRRKGDGERRRLPKDGDRSLSRFCLGAAASFSEEDPEEEAAASSTSCER